MSFLSELNKQRRKLKGTETVVTNIDGVKYVEGTNRKLEQSAYGFVVDTKPDDTPILITDYVYIGSQDCAVDEVLRKYDITVVLSLGINMHVTNVDQKFVNVLDLPESDIRHVLMECLPFIHEGVQLKRNVLIHCNAGVSRTSMVAIGYLMHYANMQFVEAYNLVKTKRPAIHPNAGFTKQLQDMKPGEIIKI